jgi:hypothetical protein
VIDDQDHLVRVDPGYYRFAEENGWGGAGESLGRSLWDFVAGDDLERLERMLVRRIRDETRSVELPFRCDGPEVRREMDLEIAANSSGRYVVFSARMRSEVRREEAQPLLAPRAPRGDPTLTMCGWCDRFLAGGEWVEVEEVAIRLGLFRLDELPEIGHQICPDCTGMLMAA